MKNFLRVFIILIIIFYSKSYSFDKTNLISTKLHEDTFTQYADSTNNNVNLFNQSLENFIQKYSTIIGSLLGAFLAGLVAIFSVWKTNKNNLNLEVIKYKTQKRISENIYCGLLFSIYSEMIAHNQINKNLVSEINQFLRFFEDNLFIPVENPFSKFPLDLIKICRNKILDFSSFDTENLVFISNYINLLDSVHNNLNLSRIKSYFDSLDNPDKNQLIKNIELYFNQILNTLRKLSEIREKIIAKIPEIIDSFPQSDVKFENLNNVVNKNNN